MGKPKKPTAQLELVGAFKKNPQRKRNNEPVCTEALIKPPIKMDKGVKQAWDFLVETCVPGVLTKMDSAYLALCARCLSKVWLGDVDVTESAKVSIMLGKLGMSPSERSNVVVPKKEKANPWAKYKG